MLKRCICIILAVLICIFSSGCNGVKKYSSTSIDYFDTVTTVSGYFNSSAEFESCLEKTKVFLEKYHKMFDIYDNYSKINNIKTINDNAGIKPVKVESEIIELLEFSIETYNLTDGMVNVCAGSVIKLWKDALKNKEIPDASEIKKASKHISIDNLIIDKENMTVYLSKKQCSIDVGAVAKGFVCEKFQSYAKTIGFENGILNLGGNVLTIGLKEKSEKFSVGIVNPEDTSKNLFTVSVSGESVVTSGDYERYYEVDGMRFNHIINPKLLEPADNNKSVSIISKNASLADALSTALFIMPYQDGLKLVNEIENCEALIIDTHGEQHFSNEFKKYIRKGA